MHDVFEHLSKFQEVACLHSRQKPCSEPTMHVEDKTELQASCKLDNARDLIDCSNAKKLQKLFGERFNMLVVLCISFRVSMNKLW